MIYQKEILLPSYQRGYHLITDLIINELEVIPNVGLLNVFIHHTSAALCLNENADSSVRRDFETIINQLIPENNPIYTHTLEGDDDMPAHIKSSILGVSVNIPVVNGRVSLGTWQGIYLCEFRNNGGRRKITVTITY